MKTNSSLSRGDLVVPKIPLWTSCVSKESPSRLKMVSVLKVEHVFSDYDRPRIVLLNFCGFTGAFKATSFRRANALDKHFFQALEFMRKKREELWAIGAKLSKMTRFS